MPWLVALTLILGIVLGVVIAITWTSLNKSASRDNQSCEHIGKAILSVVNHNYDEAMEHLEHLLNRTTDNVDAYMALSNLYRNKGWFHRSIDIRRRLLARGVITPDQRHAIMLGMVFDYQRAGLIGRAIEAMKVIIEMTEPTKEDYEILAGLYEVAGHLQNAADIWKKIGHDENHAYVRAEQARLMMQNGDITDAKKYIGHTLKLHKHNPAALLMMGDIAAKSGKISQAEKMFDRLQKIRPDLTGVIADLLEKIAIETQNSQTQAFFVELLESQKNRPRVAVRYAAYLAGLNRIEDARHVIEKIDTAELAPETMARLVDISYRCGAVDAAAKYGLETIKRFLDNKPFVCHACKELVFMLEWKCPKCGRWGTIRSRRSYPISS
jgi:lipopolysaccharide biosynthesis regulator YciM